MISAIADEKLERNIIDLQEQAASLVIASEFDAALHTGKRIEALVKLRETLNV